MKYLYTPPGFLKKWFPEFIWNSHTNKILLTFDDSPNEQTTEIILDSLDRNSLKACFFCVGSQILRNPGLMKEIIDSGNTVGNHSKSHSSLIYRGRRDLVTQIRSVNELLIDNFGYIPKYFRPPYGLFNLQTRKVVNELGLKMIVWSLFTFDYKNDLNIVKFVLDKYLAPNSIIVMHDNEKTKNIISDEIDIVLETVSRKGFEIGEPPECLS